MKRDVTWLRPVEASSVGSNKLPPECPVKWRTTAFDIHETSLCHVHGKRNGFGLLVTKLHRVHAACD